MRTHLTLLVFTVLTVGVVAQPSAKPGATATKPATPPVASAPGKTGTKPGAAPSRALLDLATWLSERGEKLAIKERTYDPFLRVKDPTKIPPKPVPGPVNPISRNDDPDVAPRDPKLLFAEAVAALKVDMVGAGLFGVAGSTTTLREGETFVLGAGEGEGQIKFNTKVLSVGAKAIVLENTANGHRVNIEVKSTSDLPSGMTRGGSGPPAFPFRPSPGN